MKKLKQGFLLILQIVDGCVATGKTKREVEQNMQEALEFHVQGLLMENQTIPHSHTYSNYVEVEATA